VARAKIALLSKRLGLELKQTYAKEGKSLRRRAGGYAHCAARTGHLATSLPGEAAPR
jgi:hypothetical protein